MKISLDWLNDFIDVSGISPEDLAHQLTMAGLEVEGIEYLAAEFENFVIAEVRKKEKHPKADKLSLCSVFDGREELQIVCGAPNVAEGQKVVLAKVGAKIPALDLEIKPVKIRNIESFGMLCSEREIGLSDDHSGIMVLSEGPEAGTPLAQFLEKTDIVFEIGITPNRPDALSHLGIARDISTILSLPLKNIEPQGVYEPASCANGEAEVIIENMEGCPRYSAVIVKGVSVRESPKKIRRRLNAVGVRSINNIVDVTNYFLHAFGQPLHAFDLDKLSGGKIIVRDAGTQKQFVTLDSKTRELEPGFLMICDSEKAVAMAGVMGGENSEVTTKTTNILIESAYFHPGKIRRASKKTGLSSDSSYRFERGTNPGNTLQVAKMAAEMMVETGGGAVLSTPIDVCSEQAISPKQVTLRFARISRILGYEVPPVRTAAIVSQLGFTILKEDEQKLLLGVPLWRPDIEREIDVIEEVARISGYDNIPTIEQIATPLVHQTDEFSLLDKLRSFFIAAGANEIVSNSLVSQHTSDAAESAIQILNPQSAEMSSLRTALLPGILNTLRRNISVGEKNLLLFEAGHCFRKKSEAIASFSDFTEFEELALVMTGNASEKEWYTGERKYDFFDLKGIVERFFEISGLADVVAEQGNPLEPGIFGYYLTYSCDGVTLASAGKIREEITKSFDIQQEVYYFEVNIDIFKKMSARKHRYHELLRFPKVLRDMAIVVDKSTNTGIIAECIRKAAGENLRSVKVFDVFENDSLGFGKKSVAFAFEFYNPERTLTDEEVEKEFKTIIAVTEKEFNAKLRG